ncbi:MAG: serine/threonine-protein kinase [Propionicimonas sp.]
MSGFPKVGDRFGGYQITGVIGHGGMGMVFSARQQGLNRPVALKVLDPKFADDPEFFTRFAREAETLASMDSPHVIQVFDHGTVEGCLYLATQWVAGGDLAAYLAQHGPLPPALAIDLTAQVASALADAHSRGVIHRDVKPSNVLLARTGQDMFAYLCDFGIAQSQEPGLTQTGLLAGSLAFTAPERHEGHPATERSDLYSLGCLLWVVLTGSNPYQGTDFQIANQHLIAPIPSLQADGPLERGLNGVLSRLMAKDPRDRPDSAVEVVGDLRQLARLAQGTGNVDAVGETLTADDLDVTRVRPRTEQAGPARYLPNTAVGVSGPLGVQTAPTYPPAPPNAVFGGADTIRRSDLAPPPPAAPSVTTPGRPTQSHNGRLILVGAVALAVVLAGAGLWIWRGRISDAAAGSPSQPASATSAVVPSAAATTTGAGDLPAATPASIDPRSPAFSRGRKIGTKGSQAHAVATDPGSQRAFVTNYGSGTVSVIDLKTHSVTQRLLGGGSGCVQPESVAVSQATQQLLVTCGGSRSLFVFDLATLQEATSLDTPAGPLRVTVNETARKAYVAPRGAAALMVVNLDDPGSTPESIKVGSKPQSVAVDEERQIAYVSRWENNKVSIVDLGEGRTTGHLTVGRNPNGLAVAPGAGLVIVPNYGASGQPAPTTYTVDFFDLEDGRKVHTTRLDNCQRPGRIAVDEPAGVAYLTCQNSDRIEVIDLSSREPIGSGVGVPPRPAGIAVDATTGDVLVTSFNDSVVQVVHS